MNDLNHYGVKGMEWGKRKKLGIANSIVTTSVPSITKVSGVANTINPMLYNDILKKHSSSMTANPPGTISGSAIKARPYSEKISSGGRSRPRRKSRRSAQNGERLIVEDVSGSISSSVPRNTKSNRIRSTAKKAANRRTSNTVRSNVNSSVDSSAAMTLVRQYKALIDRLLASYSATPYSAPKKTTPVVQNSKPVYKVGTADAKVKTKKRG